MPLFDPAPFLVFLTASLWLNLTPGPDMIYVTARTLSGGRRAGIVSALGITTGRCIHLIALLVGLAALLSATAYGMQLVRYVGAAYLIYLGLRHLMGRSDAARYDANGSPALNGQLRKKKNDHSLKRIYAQGVLVNTLNPKVALFYLAFLPQFVDPSRGNPVLQLVILGLIQNVGGTIVQLFIACGFDALLKRLRGSANLADLQKRLTGAILFGLGVRIAVRPLR